ncbi:acrosomal protein SP-10 isoform X1 [Sturnira hondurensis]|uniref:acrosomal protein SP-10 isoform X1 n=1 Tax=Sturnira hondurensis TaxID=192404 RepID=UPI001879D860|nr:acrosomal protein SP-10 isoform X1 [Sturnira hondurensis]
MKEFLLLMCLYLLGSARGASGKPDKPPGSVNHQASAQRFSGEPGSGDHAAGSEHTADELPSGDQLSGEKPFGDQPSGDQPSGDQSSGDQSSGEQPLGEQASGEQDSGEKQLGEQPADTPSSNSSGPALKCVTCSYMNDQGKCLRGDGVCTAHKSQQCMLKKIFEAGKLQFMVQGCENMCPSMNLFSHGTRMHIICCKNQSFCNKI